MPNTGYGLRRCCMRTLAGNLFAGVWMRNCLAGDFLVSSRELALSRFSTHRQLFMENKITIVPKNFIIFFYLERSSMNFDLSFKFVCGCQQYRFIFDYFKNTTLFLIYFTHQFNFFHFY